jgi:hypothetical protein
MDTIGLDLHKRETQLSIITDSGALSERRIVTSRERFTAVLGNRERAQILIEASTESEWVAEHLESLVWYPHSGAQARREEWAGSPGVMTHVFAICLSKQHGESLGRRVKKLEHSDPGHSSLRLAAASGSHLSLSLAGLPEFFTLCGETTLRTMQRDSESRARQ